MPREGLFGGKHVVLRIQLLFSTSDVSVGVALFVGFLRIVLTG